MLPPRGRWIGAPPEFLVPEQASLAIQSLIGRRLESVAIFKGETETRVVLGFASLSDHPNLGALALVLDCVAEMMAPGLLHHFSPSEHIAYEPAQQEVRACLDGFAAGVLAKIRGRRVVEAMVRWAPVSTVPEAVLTFSDGRPPAATLTVRPVRMPPGAAPDFLDLPMPGVEAARSVHDEPVEPQWGSVVISLGDDYLGPLADEVFGPQR